MSKRLILILALAFVVGLAFAAYAETQNVKVSGDIEAMTVFRNRFDFRGKSFTQDANSGLGTLGTGDNIFLSIARIRVDADLTDNVSATVRLISEFIWGHNDNSNAVIYPHQGYFHSHVMRDSSPAVDIDLAYVTLKEFLYSPLTLIVGRQELHYGNDMIIGDSDTNRIDARGNIPGDLSKRKSFDAIRAILNYDPLVVDVVYAKVSSAPWWAWNGLLTNQTGLNGHAEKIGDRKDNDTDLVGVNARYDLGRKYNTVVEGYYWYRRIGPSAFGTNPNSDIYIPYGGIFKGDQLHTYGARIVNKSVENLTLQLEAALQKGRMVTSFDGDMGTRRTAWALETAATYDFKKVKYTPSLTGLYSYFSGENTTFGDDSRPTKFRGWDPMFENQSFGAIANALLPQTNVQLLGVIATAKPMDDITLKGEYYRYWFIQPYYFVPNYYYNYFNDNLLSSNRDSRDAGQEVDLTLTYDYTEDVQLSILGGMLFPGDAFVADNNKMASEVIGSMKVTF